MDVGADIRSYFDDGLVHLGLDFIPDDLLSFVDDLLFMAFEFPRLGSITMYSSSIPRVKFR